MSDTNSHDRRDQPGKRPPPAPPADQPGIIVFGGGGGSRGCSGRGCLFWIVLSVVLSVGLTILVNLILLLFSGGGSGINV